MSLGPLTASNNTQSLAQELFKRLDTNGDDKLTADEFTNFLEKLLHTFPASDNSTAGVGTAATAGNGGNAGNAGVALSDVKPLTRYAAINGWDTNRLNDPTEMSDKYQFMRGLQDLGYPAPTAENLQNLVIPYLQSKGLNITLKEGSSDVVVINNTPYTQDVIRDVGGPDAGWQMMNTAEADAYHRSLTGTS